MSAKVKMPPEVVIAWLDARDWNTETLAIDQVAARVCMRPRESRGWLVYVGPDLHSVDVHIIAHTYDPPEEPTEPPTYGDFTCIPTGWITGVKYRTGRPKKVVKDEQQG